MKILLVVYDNDAYMHVFPVGLAYIAAVLIKEGFEVEIYNQDVHHYPNEHLTDYLNINKFDVVGIGVIGGYYQYAKLLKISKAINDSKNRPFFIIGGHGPSPEPEYFLKKTLADAVVIGEGETTIVELVTAVANKKTLSNVRGIAFREGENCFINERRDVIKDIDSIPFPAYDLFPIDYYRLVRMPHASASDFVMSVLSARGCTFRCNFCYRMEKGYRSRSNESIIEEIRLLKQKFGINYIAFNDELLMSSKERTSSLCEALLAANLNIKWRCEGRLNYAVTEILSLMKRAGCVFINYGIESLDDEVLKNINKSLTTEQINNGIKATLKAGISPGFNIIFGNIGDTHETLNKGVEFLLAYDDGAQLRTIRPVTPYPGSPLYYYALEKGLLRDCADFYENKHVNSDLLSVNFTTLKDVEVHAALFNANKKLISNYFKQKEKIVIKEAHDLYFESDISFRGFRQQ